MNKLAAEKVAHQAYIQGTQKALHELEFVKQAMDKVSADPSILRKIIGEAINRPVQAASGVAGAGLGSVGGLHAAHTFAPDSSLLEALLQAGGAAAGAVKGLQSAPKVIKTPELVWKEPGLASGGFRLR